MSEPISAPPSTSSHSTSGYPSPLPPKQTQKEFTRFISPTHKPLYFQSLIPLDPTSAPCVLPSAIPSTGPSTIPGTDLTNIFLSPVPYAIPNHSPSGPYLLPYFIPDTVFSPSDLSSMSPSKELYKHISSDRFLTPIFIPYSTTTTFSRTLQLILPSKILHNRQIHITITLHHFLISYSILSPVINYRLNNCNHSANTQLPLQVSDQHTFIHTILCHPK